MSLLDETMKSKFNLYPVQDEVESILLENIEGNTFKQNILNYAFGKMPITTTEKIPYVFNAAYGFAIKLEDFLKFVYKHEYPEVINLHLTPINLQIPNIALFSHLIVQYLNNSHSKLFPGNFPYQSIPIENINNTLYILNHISKYIDEVPPYIYYTQYFLQGNFNPMLNQTPMQIKAPERKILNYVPAYKPTIQQLMNKIDPEFTPSTSKPQQSIISTAGNNNIKSESIEVLETYNTMITKEQLKSLIEKSREIDNLRMELAHQKEINENLKSQTKSYETNEIIFERIYNELIKEKDLYNELKRQNEQQEKILDLSVKLNTLKIQYEEIKKINEQLRSIGQIESYNKQLHEIIKNLTDQQTKSEEEINKQKLLVVQMKETFKLSLEEQKELLQNKETLIKQLSFDNDILSKENESNKYLISQTNTKVEKLLEINRSQSKEVLELKSKIEDQTIEISQLNIIKDELNHLKERLSDKRGLLNRTFIEYVKQKYDKDIDPFAIIFQYKGEFYVISKGKLYLSDISKILSTEIPTLP